MRIQHNISALNSYRQLKTNNSAVSKNLEKLSSGYAINRAGDNAAGLAISEKMRGQIRGLDQAESNAQDGISLIQTAEGGLNETHSILQRMRELAVQSSNGTYQNEVDRENLQQETDALKSEIDRISSSTHFNKIQLLDGSQSGNGTTTTGVNSAITVGASEAAKANGEYGYVNATAGVYTASTQIMLGSNASSALSPAGGTTFDYTLRTKENGVESQYTVSLTVDTTTGKLKAADGTLYDVAATATGATTTEVGKAVLGELAKTGLKDSFDIKNTAGVLEYTAKTAGTSAPSVVGISYDRQAPTDATKIGYVSEVTVSTPASDGYETMDAASMIAYDGTNADKATFTVNGQKFAFVADSTKAASLDSDVNYIVTAATNAIAAGDADNMAKLINQKTGLATDTTGTKINYKASSKTSTSNVGGITFQIGANGTKDQRVSLTIGDMSSTGIGVKNVSIATQSAASKAIGTIDDAINKVSKQRAGLGALQNRLEHTVSNLGTTSENLTSAESRIRDVDMAKEMVAMSKNNILVQAAQSMLAQANTQPQGVLQLLK